MPKQENFSNNAQAFKRKIIQNSLKHIIIIHVQCSFLFVKSLGS